MNQKKINEIEKLKEPVYGEVDPLKDMVDTINELLDALQDEPGNNLYDDNTWNEACLNNYSKGYQQAIKDAIAAIPEEVNGTSPPSLYQQTIKAIKKLQKNNQ